MRAQAVRKRACAIIGGQYLGNKRKHKQRTRAHALGAQCFSLRQKIKKSDFIYIFLDDIKAVVSLFYAG